MKIRFLGTCAGTEPIPNHRHTSILLEKNNQCYWLDAGENSAYAAHTGGVNLLSTQAIFISHTHMDHIGGLPNLMWYLRKLQERSTVHPKPLTGKTIDLKIPNLQCWQHILGMLEFTEGDFHIDFKIQANPISKGIIYQDHNLLVEAFPNKHMGTPAPGHAWQSYSFRIRTPEITLVYSGDIYSIDELLPIIDGATLVLVETGHHDVEETCVTLRDSGASFETLGFYHHGRAILENPEREKNKALSILGDRIVMSYDGMTLEL